MFKVHSRSKWSGYTSFQEVANLTTDLGGPLWKFHVRNKIDKMEKAGGENSGFTNSGINYTNWIYHKCIARIWSYEGELFECPSNFHVITKKVVGSNHYVAISNHCDEWMYATGVLGYTIAQYICFLRRNINHPAHTQKKPLQYHRLVFIIEIPIVNTVF